MKKQEDANFFCIVSEPNPNPQRTGKGALVEAIKELTKHPVEQKTSTEKIEDETFESVQKSIIEKMDDISEEFRLSIEKKLYSPEWQQTIRRMKKVKSFCFEFNDKGKSIVWFDNILFIGHHIKKLSRNPEFLLHITFNNANYDIYLHYKTEEALMEDRERFLEFIR
jgi:hypothetical protein